MPQKKQSDEQRLLGKVKILSVVLLLSTVVFISVAVVLIPAINPEYRIPEGILIAVLASLTTSALGLAGVALRKDG